MAAGEPLPSDAPESGEPAPAPKPARPPPQPVKFSTMLLVFLFLLGIIMLFDTATRNQVAGVIGVVFQPLIGFGGHYLLLTMFLAAAIEMLLTALAYNWTTDWIKAAKVQSWSAAFRKVQMAALRSGKKDRIDAIKPHQDRLTRLSSEVSLAQLKGMAVTWFLVIAIYTWVGLYILHVSSDPSAAMAAHATVNIGGTEVSLLQKELIMPLWFLLFSLYTVPFSLVFRRILKHYWLRSHVASSASPMPPDATAGGAGGSS